MYSTLAFVVPVTLLRLPYSLASALTWAAIVYYPVNMAPEADRFFTFILLLFLLHKYGPEHIATTSCGILCVQCNAASLYPTMRGLHIILPYSAPVASCVLLFLLHMSQLHKEGPGLPEAHLHPVPQL